MYPLPCHAYCLRSPVAKSWDLLSTDLPILYTPTDCNTTLRLTVKDNADNIDSSLIYNLTLLGLADIVSSTAVTHGQRYFPQSGEGNATFATSFQPLNLQFMMNSFNKLPVYAVTDVLKGMQELAHYLLFPELSFEVFSDGDSTSPPIASGCLAFHCGIQIRGDIGTVNIRALQLANFSAANFTSATSSRQLQTSIAPIELTILDELEAVAVTYDDLSSPRAIHDQGFADAATRILANITNLIIANQGDDLLPFSGHSSRRLFRYVDNWGSELDISLLPWNLLGTNFTLGQAAMALKRTQENLSNRPMVETRLTIMLDGSMIGWGCLSYGRLCMMPTPGSTSSVGSGKEILIS